MNFQINLKDSTGRPNALLVAPRGGSAEIAAYTTGDGAAFITNANITPYAPNTGLQMQVISTKTKTISPLRIAGMVKVGHCEACDNNLVATASLADQIETAGGTHCPYCSSEVKASIDTSELIKALADEYDDSNDDEEDAPADSDEGDEDSGYSDDDDDSGDTGDDESAEDDDEAPSDDDEAPSDDDEAPPDDDEGDDAKSDEDDGEESTASGEDCDDTEAMDDEDSESNENEEDAAVEELRANMTALGMGEEPTEMVDEDESMPDSEDVVEDDDAIPDEDELDENPGVEDDDDGYADDEVYPDDDMDSAVAAFKKVVTAAYNAGERPIAGHRRSNDTIDRMNTDALAAIRERRGNKPDGNVNFKPNNAQAAIDDFTSDSITPGTNPTEGEMNKQLDTPGTNYTPVEDSDEQDVTPGTSETSGEFTTDWKNDKIELVSTSDATSRWVFANGRPVARLIRSKAVAGVVEQWDNIPVLQKTFASACQRGLPREEAKEFGFVAHLFKVEGSDVIRKAMHRHADLATNNAQGEIARGVTRYKQSLKSATIAAMKGVYPDLGNKIRDRLVASLSAMGVAEPRSVVDTAFANTADAFLVDVFKKADEIANKSDAARDEVASFVANASYQSRIDEGSNLAARLASNSKEVVAGGFHGRQASHASTNPSETHDDRVRRALRSIR